MANSKALNQGVIQSTDATQLLEGCVRSIEQCGQLLQLISAEAYVDSSRGTSSVGAHIRHILDRFHCFLAGMPAGSIDYDARKRDKSIENNLDVATFALVSVSRRIETMAALDDLGTAITVRESVHHQGPAVTMPSTVGRELMGLVTHSIHHLAIIALIVKSYGYEMDSDFGKAASTILYERA
ncbi:MAG: hypothetical protein IIC10_01155 [Proteobacteria bacterium]|nr:hypothetical protein [Pseudomonadota bacterium]